MPVAYSIQLTKVLFILILALSTGGRVCGVCGDDDDVVEEGPLVDEAARGGAQVHEGDERDPTPERVHQLLAQLEAQHFACDFELLARTRQHKKKARQLPWDLNSGSAPFSPHVNTAGGQGMKTDEKIDFRYGIFSCLEEFPRVFYRC
jgi:hypothetical protein